MFAPRSFLKEKAEYGFSEKRSVPLQRKKKAKLQSAPPALNKAPPPTSTSPVLIPVKQKPMASKKESISSKKDSVLSKKISKPKDTTSQIPSSVAALLASTTIPPPKSRKLSTKKVSVERLRQEWKADFMSSSLSRGSPLDLLLEPDYEPDQPSPEENEEGPAPSRSMSTDSILSTPSLEFDDACLSSSFSSPKTPSSGLSLRRASRYDRKVSSPPAVSVLSHPLLALPELPTPESISPIAFVPIKPVKRAAPTSAPKSSITSNLSLSFSRLKSAAKSFSNFTAPSLPSDDFLTRSLFSSRYAPEMRPSFRGKPDPALRRYLNPTMSTTPANAHQALTDAGWVTGETEAKEAKSIMMVSYVRARSVSPKRPSVIELEEHVVPMVIARQREPRENSNFLRMIVGEMNMRRSGKIDANAPGHARIWLPPRSETVMAGGMAPQGMIPERWVGISIDDI